MAYKDLSLLTKNRMTHLIPEEGEDDTEQSEVMVIDSLEAEQCVDSQIVTFFQGRKFDGNVQYLNIQYIVDALKQYRDGMLDGVSYSN